ncbi:MAG: PAS domain S-box protein [Planctomyces sp.]|nr:PAS domain S-box protein [Planctomyces sp.]
MMSDKSYQHSDSAGEPVASSARSGSVCSGSSRASTSRFPHDSEQRIQLLLESSDIGFWERDLTSDRLYWCPREEQLMGFMPGTFPGTIQAFHELVHPEDLEVLKAAQQTASQNGGHYSAELRFRTLDGRLRWAHVRGVIIYENGSPVRIVGVDIDTTDRKRAEERIQSSEAFLERVVRSVPGAVFTFRLANRRASFQYVSPGAYDIFGVTAERLMEDARTVAGFLHPEDVRLIRNSIFESASGLTAWHGELRLNHPDKGWIWIEGRSQPEVAADQSIVWTGFAADITNRKRLDAALEQQRRKLQLILDSVPALIFVKGRDHRFRRVNREVCRLLGLASHQIEGKTAEELGSEFAVRYNRDDEYVITSGLPLRGIVEPMEATTGTRWLQTDRIPFTNEQGETVGIIGLAVDITDRLRAEGALRLSEARLREAQAIAQTGSFYWNAAEDRATWSEELYRIFEREPREFSPSVDVYLSLVHPDDRQRVASELHRAILELNSFRHDYRLITPGGTLKWMRATGRVVRSEDGELMGLTGTCQDITSQRLAEEALKSSEELYRRLLDVIPSAVIILTNDLIQYCNRSMLRLVGANSNSSVIGRSPLDFVSADHHEWVRDHVPQLLASGESATIPELSIIRLDGEYVPAEVVVTPIIYERRLSVLVALHDLSVRRRTDEQLRHAQRMEVVGRLAGGVAHDFNNLLTVILSCAEIVLETMPSEDSRYKLIESIRNAGDRAAGLTRQLLTFSRRQVLKLVELDLNDVIRQSLLMLRRVIGEDIHIEADLAVDLPAVEVDPVQMEQVLMNIVVNARDAMPCGGVLTISTEPIFLHGSGHAHHLPHLLTGRFVCLTISDTGTGMTEAIREKVFDPFFTTKEPGKGTGLGLSVVHGIIQQCNGIIDVESRIDEGTTFRIMLPAAKSRAPAVAQPPVQAPVLRGHETVLLVEDEPAVRAIASHSLQKSGYHVLTASDADEATAICESIEGQIHLLATDVVLPNRSGRELAASLLLKYPHIRILFLSGYTDDEVLRYGIEESAVAFLQKPYTPESLARKVREVLDPQQPDQNVA